MYEFRHNPVGAGAFDSPEGLEFDFALVKRDVVGAVPYKLFCKKIELHTPIPFYCAKTYFLGRAFGVAGTLRCGKHSSFVPRKAKIYTPMAQYRRKLTFSIENPGSWRCLDSRGSTFPSVGETSPYRVNSHPRQRSVAAKNF